MKMKVATFLAILGLGLSFKLDSPQINPKLVGGESVDISNYPYMLSVQSNEEHICGASLISPTTAITSANCIFISNSSDLAVRAGSSNHATGGVIINVSSTIIHPAFDAIDFDSDIAIINLETEANATPIGLIESDYVIEEEMEITVLGWGTDVTTNATWGIISDDLQMAVLPVENCDGFYDTITENQFCAGGYGIGDCRYDNGGPVIVNGTLVGIMSYRMYCGYEAYPTVYTSLAPFREWIRENSDV